MNQGNPKIDFFFEKENKWKTEFEQLRKIALDCGLEEQLKWGQACYTLNNKNIVLIHGFKEYCAYLFFKGALLKDPLNILIQQTENVQVPRQIRFNNANEITKQKAVLKSYIFQAIEVEKAGLKVSLKTTSAYKIPEEFQEKLDKDVSFKKAFAALTPGRQKGYLFYFSQAKQSITRTARIEKCIPKIMKGMGIND